MFASISSALKPKIEKAANEVKKAEENAIDIIFDGPGSQNHMFKYRFIGDDVKDLEFRSSKPAVMKVLGTAIRTAQPKRPVIEVKLQFINK